MKSSAFSRKARGGLVFKRKYLCIPYALFLVLFIIIPILIIVWYAFSDANGVPSVNALVDFFTSFAKVNVLLVSLFIANIGKNERMAKCDRLPTPFHR